MTFSKKEISKAGLLILSSKSIEARNTALEKINEWRANHLHPLNVMKNALLRITEKQNIEPILVSQRLKRLTSIEYKLDLNESMGLGGMQDIGGFRAVLKDTKDLAKLKKILDKNKLNHKLKRVVDYVERPKESGYRSVHFIYIYNSKIDKYQGLLLELQIRTKLQHNWATAVETAGILTKTSLKSSQGPDEWLDFFKIVSSLFAIKEKLPVLKEHSERTMENLMVECYNFTKKLNIIPILKALRISARQIEIDNYIGDYYIININIKEMFVNITTFKKTQFEEATDEYLELEKSIEESENAVVLVSSISMKSLKKAYPSYFLDTSEFIAALEKMNQNCKDWNLVK
ncbi:RelA/SpoT family protein [Winogradskyella pacifica]|uniref:RelA/SpoT family protein n=1 Tax=Winogradskyella pacifica TaxID=664642 RepID=A0A3D9MYY4_9FLAO|nr:RelA/SpoT domain-containing protein [Winogradskyella pacifica]REE24426.1 RelA/SpoT family protein [Winogradskyella pacifica]